MKLNKIIFTSEKVLAEKLIKNFNFNKIKSEDFFEVYEWNRELYKDEENIVFVYFNDFSKSFSFIEENYDIFKLIFLWFAEVMWNNELIQWDVIIPNTFINNNENKKPIFIDYAVWEDYDLNDFWLVLNWICFTWKLENEDKEFLADIKDNEIYNLLEETQKKQKYEEIIVVIKWIEKEDNKQTSENIIKVLDLVL